MRKSIVKACVRYNNRLYTGFDHGECFKKLNEDNTILVHSEIEQGFVDSDGNFVDRKQAMVIAKESGQLRYEPNKKTLISEDLHLDWLNKQAQRIAELEDKWNKLREWARNSTEVLLYSINDRPAKLGNKKYNYFERKQLLDEIQELENGEKK